MDLTQGIEKLRSRINTERRKIMMSQYQQFEELTNRKEQYMQQHEVFSRQLTLPSWPMQLPAGTLWGFPIGYESIPPLKKGGNSEPFPVIHPFTKVSATYMAEDDANSYMITNFLIRAITSYRLGECNVFMMDANIAGQFNALSPISTHIDDYKTEKNFFHYVTISDEKEKVLRKLERVIDKNVRTYTSQVASVFEYNVKKGEVKVPYNFLFIRNIGDCLNNEQIERLAQMVNAETATKAGVYLFFTYQKSDLENGNNPWANQGLRELIENSQALSDVLPMMNKQNLVWEQPAEMADFRATLRFVEEQAIKKVTAMTFDNKIQGMLAKGDLWKTPSQGKKYHMYVPVGYADEQTEKVLDFNFKDGSPHTIIGGKTGTGKSNLINNIIVNAALNYSPEQLRFYLADMKEGSGMGVYQNLPHVAALCLTADRPYVLSILQMVGREIAERNKMFMPYNVTLLDDYNEVARQKGQPILPYKFIIIDEYQVLFSKNDAISSQANDWMNHIYKTGRSAGIFLALSTQSFADMTTSLKQVGVRLSLSNNETDSVKVLGNNGAINLRGMGRAILNTSPTGIDASTNEEFQVAYIEERQFLPSLVKQIQQIYLRQHGGKDIHDHVIFDDKQLPTHLSDNPKLAFQPGKGKGDIYLGAPHFCSKEHLRFRLHRRSKSNILIVGDDSASALRLVGSILLQYHNLYQGSKSIVVDMQNTTASTARCLNFLAQSRSNEVQVMNESQLVDAIGKTYRLYTERMAMSAAERDSAPPLMLALVDLRPVQALMEKSNSSASAFAGARPSVFGNLGRTNNQADTSPSLPSASTMLNTLIKEGYNAGVHVLIYCYNTQNLTASFANNMMFHPQQEFEVRVGLSGKEVYRAITGMSDFVLLNGEGVAALPKGQRHRDGDHFLIYKSTGDQRLNGSDWDKLFNGIKDFEEEIEILL